MHMPTRVRRGVRSRFCCLEVPAQSGTLAATPGRVTPEHPHRPIAANDPVSRSAESHRRERSQPSLRLPDLGGPDRTESRAVASLVDEVVACLEASPIERPLHTAVAQCNAAIESCLAAQREGRDREEPAAARDELRHLARLLSAADRSEAVSVMRRIRRVLGRVDGRRAG